jgi:hypothetical protein
MKFLLTSFLGIRNGTLQKVLSAMSESLRITFKLFLTRFSTHLSPPRLDYKNSSRLTPHHEDDNAKLSNAITIFLSLLLTLLSVFSQLSLPFEDFSFRQ